MPQSDSLPINRRPRGVLKVLKAQKWRELREERKKKKKEEEMKPRRCRITTVINLYVVSCSVLFVRPSVSFAFKIQM